MPKPGHLHGQYWLTMNSMHKEGSDEDERHRQRKKRTEGETEERKMAWIFLFYASHFQAQYYVKASRK